MVISEHIRAFKNEQFLLVSVTDFLILFSCFDNDRKIRRYKTMTTTMKHIKSRNFKKGEKRKQRKIYKNNQMKWAIEHVLYMFSVNKRKARRSNEIFVY